MSFVPHFAARRSDCFSQDCSLLPAVAEADSYVSRLWALLALRVPARPLPVFSPRAWRRDLVHFLRHDLVVHVMVGLDIL
jgi:hypothetical protein